MSNFGKSVRSQLDSLRDVTVAVTRQKEAQATFDELLAFQMVSHADDFGVVVRARGDRRLANLEGRQWGGALALLEHEDACLRPCLLELYRERQAGQPAS